MLQILTQAAPITTELRKGVLRCALTSPRRATPQSVTQLNQSSTVLLPAPAWKRKQMLTAHNRLSLPGSIHILPATLQSYFACV